MKDLAASTANIGKFRDRHVTVGGQVRAHVALTRPHTLWFNTGTLCNIACANCYVDSSPTNDALAYISADEVADYLDDAAARGWPLAEIGFTGGEPFMNPDIIAMTANALDRGHRVLILTNAMRPMMRPRVQAGLRALQADHGDRLTLRVSLDHHRAEVHDRERGTGSFAATLAGMEWLRDQGIAMAVAGRTVWNEPEALARSGYAALFARHGFAIDALDPARTVLFPEIDENVEVPEITTSCWDILGKSPDSVMCASSRMVVKRRGAARPVVVACTLLPFDPEFELGATLAEAEGAVHLNHPHCARFCVLGGASCSG
jgi:uncharacterized Fe-S cluster-containing radical SAM superfamily protein